ncbi:membrane protein [Ferrigenium kumadai]|uniref:Membrane protein n=1 Tax=Ferrigenium kumadai TaxID=1682490 RepID=A0AAN1SYC4_9PROT|nr:bestrophin family protein [Ferrigenium kumadai]BBI98977.1 membrane protein [Ferrigenium kumadai]
MIVRGRPSGLRLFLVFRGSVLKDIWKVLLVNIVLATVVTMTHGDLFSHKITLTAIPFTLIGLPLAIFLGFRNNAAYDRYCEGRKLWGEIVLQTRNFARQCLTLIEHAEPLKAGPGLNDVRVRMIYRTIAFSHALRHLLRDTDGRAELKPLLSQQEWEKSCKSANIPDYLMHRMGDDLRLCLDEKRLDGCLASNIDATMSAITAASAACERIKSTPIPFSYTLLLHRTAYLYCFLLPFGLVDTIGFMTPFVVGLVAYTFFGLDALGDEIEEPFGNLPNDLALDAICRGVEINLRDTLGEEHGLTPMKPQNYCLM